MNQYPEKFVFHGVREQRHKKRGVGKKEYEERKGSFSPVGLLFPYYILFFPQSAQFSYHMEEAGFSKMMVSVCGIT